jgi:hypothetical protein
MAYFASAGPAIPGQEAGWLTKLEAQACNITWLPPMPQGTTQRVKLEGRGVAGPQIRKNVDTA